MIQFMHHTPEALYQLFFYVSMRKLLKNNTTHEILFYSHSELVWEQIFTDEHIKLRSHEILCPFADGPTEKVEVFLETSALQR